MKWPHDKRQGLAYALLFLAAWVQDHRDALEWYGMWLLIVLALLCGGGLWWLAYVSAQIGPGDA